MKEPSQNVNSSICDKTIKVDLEAVVDFAKRRWKLDDLHGFPHWQRVAINGEQLATPDTDPTVLRLFAYLHDSCRIDNGHDGEHGPRAAKMIADLRPNLLSGLNDEQFHTLQQAIEKHTSHHATGNPTIDACFDADRLDLIRVGIRPDPKKMATAKGKAFAADFEAYLKMQPYKY